MLRSALRSLLLAVVFALALAGSALAADPLVTTLVPSQLQNVSTHLTGTIDPMGSDVTATRFEWGPGAPGSAFSGAPVPGTPLAIPALTGGVATGNTAVKTSALITGLTPGAAYHFRLVATTAGGDFFGTDTAFSTPLAAQVKPTAVTGAATLDPSFAGATLSGTVNPSNQATTYRFHYATSPAALDDPLLRTTTPTPPALPAGTADVPVTFHIPSGASVPPLTLGTTYYFRIVATNPTGSTIGNTQTFFTGVVVPPPVPQPPVVTTLPATDVTVSTVTLQGNVNPNGQDTTYTFEFGTTVAYGTTTAPLGAGAGNAAVPATAALINLQPGTTYHYRLTATNDTGTAGGGDQTFTTAGTPPPPPTTVGPPAATTSPATGVTTGTGTLTGVVNPNGGDTTYAFQWGTTTGYGTATPPGTVPAGALAPVSFGLTGLKPGVTYHYRLVASNTANSVVGADMTFRTIPVLIMTKLRGTPASFRTRSRPIGTRLTFSLSGPGKVAIVITQPAMGGKICTGTGAARRCLPAPSTGAHVVQRISVRGHVGKNTVLFKGRPGGKALKNGEFFVSARATFQDKIAGPIRSKTLRLKLHVIG